MVGLKDFNLKDKLKDRRFQSLIGIVVLIFIVFTMQMSKRAQADRDTWVKTEKGNFVIDMTETGEIQAVNAINLDVPSDRRSGETMMVQGGARGGGQGGGGRGGGGIQVGGGGGGSIGTTQIIDLVPEGTSVKKGDILVRLDPGTIEDSITSTLEQIEQQESDLVNLDRIQEDERNTIKRNLQKAEYSREASQLALEKLKYEEKTIQEEKQLDLKKQMLSLELIEKNAEATRLNQALDRERALTRIQYRKEYLAGLRARLAATIIRAPIDGIVVYGTTGGRGPNARKISIGTSVSPGDVLIRIPDLSAMRMVAQVNEIDVDKFTEGQNVEIRLDAYEDKLLTGIIENVAAMITSSRDLRGRFRTNTATPEEAPTFEISILIDGSSDFLKPGITAKGRIIVENIPDAVYIPIGCVFEDDEGKTVVFTKNKFPIPTEVKLGKKNDINVIVESGLSGGELVSRIPPETSSFHILGWKAEMEKRRSELAELVKDIEMMRELGLTGSPARQ